MYYKLWGYTQRHPEDGIDTRFTPRQINQLIHTVSDLGHVPLGSKADILATGRGSCWEGVCVRHT